MVACHAWDVAGAEAAGLATAFLRRPGKVPYPHLPAPVIQAADLDELAREIVAADAAG
jgi:2-haloacid dehalogenase